jgi:hypothetical protein
VDLGRVRAWEWLTGLAGVALFVSLFLPWYGAEGVSGTANGWESFAVIDFILAASALLAMALVVVTATQRTAAVPQTVAAFVVWLAIVAVIVALIRLANPPGLTIYAPLESGGNLDPPLIGEETDATRELGLWLGVAAALGIFAAGWKSMRDKRFPRAMRPNLKVETIATPSPEGDRRDAAG